MMNASVGNFPGFLFSAVCSLNNILSSPYTFWFPIVVVVAIAVILIAILIGMLSPLLGRNNLVPWARLKAYEEVATIIFAIIFLSFSSMLCAINPIPALNSIGLVPTECSSSSAVPINNIWGIAVCNMYTFNTHVSEILTAGYWLNFLSDVGPKFGFSPNFGGVGISASLSLSTGPENLYLSPMYFLIIGEIMVSMLQVILLSSAPILFSFLIGIGLIARSFGITRTFGNAMIALGIGIGFIYPLLVTISYGFINTTFTNVLNAAGTSFVNLFKDFTLSFLLSLVYPLFVSSSIYWAAVAVVQIWNILSLLIFLAAIVVMGLVFIPMLNFMILDAFVRDFSSSLGQQVSFLDMLIGVV